MVPITPEQSVKRALSGRVGSHLHPVHYASAALYSLGQFLQLFSSNSNRTIEWNSGAREQGGEHVTLVSMSVREETAGLDRAAAFAGDDEGEVLACVLVPVLETGTPHHDAIVQQGAVAFAQA